MQKGRDQSWKGENGPERSSGAGGAPRAHDRTSSYPSEKARRKGRTDWKVEPAGSNGCSLCPLSDFEHSRLFSEFPVRCAPALPLRGVRRATAASETAKKINP